MIVNKNTLKKFHIAAFIISCILIACSFLYSFKINNSEIEIPLGKDINVDAFSITESKDWPEYPHGFKYGIQYDFVLKNNSDLKIGSWEAELKLNNEYKIDSYWNGEVTEENNIIRFIPTGESSYIEGGDNKGFGFVIYVHDKETIESGVAIIRYKLEIKDLIILYWIMLFWIVLFTFDISFIFNQRILNRERENINQQNKILIESFLTFSRLIDEKDITTKGYSHRVAIYSKELAKRAGLNENQQKNIFFIALLHDIGKIGISDTVLHKQGTLEKDEKEYLEQHVIIGCRIVEKLTSIPGLEDGIRYHHERYDGKGYCEGLAGEDIPLVARIICLASAFDAMTSTRTYRMHIAFQDVIKEIEKGSGTQFDPNLVLYLKQMIADGVAPVNVDENSLEAQMYYETTMIK